MAKRIGLIGGTGPEGKGLAARFARAGLEVFIGSRSADRGREAGEEISALAGATVRGGTNEDAVKDADLILVTVPYSGMRDTLEGLAPRIGARTVISAVVPLQFSRQRIAVLDVPEGSAAQETQALLPNARVVGAFQNLSARHLMDLDHDIEGDVVVCSDDPAALAETVDLAALIPAVRGINGGPLANSRYVEDMTALLLNINRIHRAETHIKIVGV